MSKDEKYAKQREIIDVTGDDDWPDDVSTHVAIDERYPDSQEGAGRYSSEAPAPAFKGTPPDDPLRFLPFNADDGTQPEALEPPAPPATPDSKGTPTPQSSLPLGAGIT